MDTRWSRSDIDINGTLAHLVAVADGVFYRAKLMVSRLGEAWSRVEMIEEMANDASLDAMEQLYDKVLRDRHEWEVESIAISPIDLWIAIDSSDRSEWL